MSSHTRTIATTPQNTQAQLSKDMKGSTDLDLQKKFQTEKFLNAKEGPLQLCRYDSRADS